MDGGDNKFQLGVSRAVPNSNAGAKMDTSDSSSSAAHKNNSNNAIKDKNGKSTNQDSSVLLRPTEDAISWSGSSSSSDILF